MTDFPDGAVQDAAQDNWVDRFAPGLARPFLRLARLDRPIGTWLLLWPCWWSLLLAAGGAAEQLPGLSLYALFALGAIAMRGAGCTYNDIVDRDLDAQVARTRNRPLPSGAVSVPEAWAFLGLQLLIGAGVLFSLNGFAIGLGLASLLLVAAYPFMKRLTMWPQLWLGLTFNWGALLGFAAVTGGLGLAPVLLYAGAIFWTLGYDTIYAHQDKEDDALVGIGSSALALGDRTKAWLGVFYAAAWAFWCLAGTAAGLGPLFALGMLAVGGHLAWQVRTLQVARPALCLRLFRSNRDLGALLLAAFLFGTFM